MRGEREREGMGEQQENKVGFARCGRIESEKGLSSQAGLVQKPPNQGPSSKAVPLKPRWPLTRRDSVGRDERGGYRIRESHVDIRGRVCAK